MRTGAIPVYNRGLASFRRIFRSSEAALVLLAVVVGAVAGVLMIAQRAIAHFIQSLIYGLSGPSLSAAVSVNPLSLIALPVFGLILGFGSRAAIRRWRTPVDVVEANALHGGAIPMARFPSGLRPDPVVERCGSLGRAGSRLCAGRRRSRFGVRPVASPEACRHAHLGRRRGRCGASAPPSERRSPAPFTHSRSCIGAYTPAAIAPVGAACLAAVLLVRFARVRGLSDRPSRRQGDHHRRLSSLCRARHRLRG